MRAIGSHVSKLSGYAPALPTPFDDNDRVDCDLSLRQRECARAQRVALALAPLTAALFREPNPVPLKYALNCFGLMSPRVRLPLIELGERAKTEVAVALARLCDEYAASMIGKIGHRLSTRRAATAS